MCRILSIFSALLIVTFGASAYAVDEVAQTPNWQQLNSAQQLILAPLSDRWDVLPELQRKRILLYAKRYPKMREVEKKRFAGRLLEWTKLTSEQRNLARDKFRQFQNLPRPEREAIIRRWRVQQATAKKHQLEQVQSPQPVPNLERPTSSPDPVADDLPNRQTGPTATEQIR